MDHIDAIQSDSGLSPGIPTGFAELDEITAGEIVNCCGPGVVQATSISVVAVMLSVGSDGVMSEGRSSSLPLWKTAPARRGRRDAVR